VRGAKADEFRVVDVAERVAPYDFEVRRPDLAAEPDELVQRAATLLLVMPPNQHRSTIEDLLSPDDPDRGRRAIDALIESAFVEEDSAGHLRRFG
jgi:hypothetical protein